MYLWCVLHAHMTENFAHYFWWSQTDWTFFVGLEALASYSHRVQPVYYEQKQKQKHISPTFSTSVWRMTIVYSRTCWYTKRWAWRFLPITRLGRSICCFCVWRLGHQTKSPEINKKVKGHTLTYHWWWIMFIQSIRLSLWERVGVLPVPMLSWKLSVLEIPLDKELTANCLIETCTKLEKLIS